MECPAPVAIAVYGLCLPRSLVTYLVGTVHVVLVVNVGLRKAILMGMLPSIPGDTLRVLAAALLYWKSNRRLNQVFLR
ncbi:MAG: hypothetical protein GTO13_08855 [Proteobacteria bacterium]|nr:hypothetical protein [Pseudomonadota bacterium]